MVSNLSLFGMINILNRFMKAILAMKMTERSQRRIHLTIEFLNFLPSFGFLDMFVDRRLNEDDEFLIGLVFSELDCFSISF
jgi:hypothetical protein